MKWFPLEDGTKTEIRIPKNRVGQDVIKPNEFITIATEQGNTLLEKAAFRDISILIGKYLRIGISEHTTKRQIKMHLERLREVVAKTAPANILEGLDVDGLTYDRNEDAFYLPARRGEAGYLRYKYYVKGDPESADLIIPLGDGTSVMVNIEGPAAGKADKVRFNAKEQGPGSLRVTRYELRNFIVAIEAVSPGQRPPEGSPEERLLDLNLSQITRITGQAEISRQRLAILARRANTEWKRLGSDRRVRIDDKRDMLHVYFVKAGKTEPTNAATDYWSALKKMAPVILAGATVLLTGGCSAGASSQ